MRYVISVGANLGDAHESVARALVDVPNALLGTGQVASSLYSTSPVGGPEQSDYVNAVVVVDSPMAPRDVLAALQELEAQAHRTRDIRWGPRTLDLDIITADGVESDDPVLTLPHPRAHERAFVLIPWLEVESAARLPRHGAVINLIEQIAPDQHVAKIDAGEAQ